MYSATVFLLVACAPLLIQARSGTPVGGPRPAELTDERKNQLVKYSMDAYHNQDNSAFQYKVVDVKNITSQVVSGALYKLDLEIGETDCRKGTVGKECKLKTPDGSKNKNCSFEIHEQPWRNYRSVTVKRCNAKQA